MEIKEKIAAEYNELVGRIERLKNMLDNWGRDELSFEPACPKVIYEIQLKAMNDYRAALEARALIEKIELW